MAVFTDRAPAPAFYPFIVTGKSSDFPRAQADRLALLAAMLEQSRQAEGRANG